MTPFSIPFCKRLVEILGEFETECWYDRWCRCGMGYCGNFEKKIPPKESIEVHREGEQSTDGAGDCCYFEHSQYATPCPSFQELLRLMPKIWMEIDLVKGSELVNRTEFLGNLCDMYALAPTEPEAIKAVEDYLTPLLK